MQIKATGARLLLILLLTTGSFSFVRSQSPLTGGAISNPAESIGYNTIPSIINATVATGGGECAGSYLYGWQQSTDGVSFSYISGATTQNYQPPALTVSTYFRRRSNCGHSNANTSNTAFITVSAPGFYGGCIDSSSQTINDTLIPGPIGGSPPGGGACSNSYLYQWQISPDNIYFVNIPGATSQALTFGAPLRNTSYFRRKAICLTLVQYTNTATITVNPVPRGTLTGTVDLRARPAKPHVQWVVNMRVDFYKTGNPAPQFSRVVTTDTNGHFTVDEIPIGIYTILIKPSNKLSKVKRNKLITTGSNTVEFSLLEEGDVNNDNRVNLADLNIMLKAYNTTYGYHDFDIRCDMNGDGYVGLSDFSILIPTYNHQGEIP